MLLLASIVSLLSFLTVGCDTTSPNPSPAYSFNFIELDSIWVLDSPQYQRMVVRVYPKEYGERRTMRCLVRGNGVSTYFNLYDDAGELPRDDATGFCDTVSGDFVAGDGKFTRRLNSLFTGHEGTYQLTVAFQDHPPGIDTLYGELIVAANSPPTIRWISAEDSVWSAGSVPPFRVVVRDFDGQEDIATVEIGRSDVPRGNAPGSFYPMTKLNDSLYQLVFFPELGAGYPTGDHSFYCRAADWAMRERDENSFSDTVQVWMENSSPEIDSIVAPDTVWVEGGANDFTLFHIDISIHDDQTPLDFDTLLMTLSRYDENLGREIDVFDTIFFDTGMGNDTLTAPGVIRTGWSANRNNKLNTQFTFTWTPSDRSPQRGESRSNVIIIMSAGNGMPGRDEEFGGGKLVDVFR